MHRSPVHEPSTLLQSRSPVGLNWIKNNLCSWHIPITGPWLALLNFLHYLTTYFVGGTRVWTCDLELASQGVSTWAPALPRRNVIEAQNINLELTYNFLYVPELRSNGGSCHDYKLIKSADKIWMCNSILERKKKPLLKNISLFIKNQIITIGKTPNTPLSKT
jgi:hypothetical protein